MRLLINVRIWPAMALKHGFDTAEDYKRDALRKFSLLETGILQKPSTRLLLVNVWHMIFEFPDV
jgi:hypothetical protein